MGFEFNVGRIGVSIIFDRRLILLIWKKTKGCYVQMLVQVSGFL